MKSKSEAKSHDTRRKSKRGRKFELQVIPAPTIMWHPSVSLEKLLSDFAEHQDSIIVS
jgi:hypothetical protein